MSQNEMTFYLIRSKAIEKSKKQAQNGHSQKPPENYFHIFVSLDSFQSFYFNNLNNMPKMFQQYKINMRKFNAIVSNTEITSQQPIIQLHSNLSYGTIKDNQIIEFYLKNQSLQISKHIIYPISFNQVGEIWDVIFNQFGTSLNEVPEQDLKELSSQQFVKQLCFMYHQLGTLKPIIMLQNIYFLQKQPLKIKILACCKTDQEYLTNFHSLMKKVSKDQKQILELTHKITNVQDIKLVYSQQREGVTLSKLLQLKFVTQKPPYYQIQIEQTDKLWIFNTLGFPAIPKHELIYNGIQYNFDPIPLLKAIFKLQVFYILETIKGNRVVFYPAVKYESNSSSIFGTYLADKQKKSMILGLNKKSIHQLQQQQFAVGYGTQILLAIGKIDIIISAFNIQNICYFPISYKPDDKSGVSRSEDLLGNNFKLKQIQVYKIN